MDLCGQSLRSMYVMHRSACNESACCSDIHDRCHFSAFLLNFKLLTHTTNKESQTLGTLLRHQLPSSLMQASAALKGIFGFCICKSSNSSLIVDRKKNGLCWNPKQGCQACQILTWKEKKESIVHLIEVTGLRRARPSACVFEERESYYRDADTSLKETLKARWRNNRRRTVFILQVRQPVTGLRLDG